MELREFMKKKFNTDNIDEVRAKLANSPLNGMAEAVGIIFNKERKMVNSVNSHCLMELAHMQSLGDAMAEELFHAYFIRGEDAGDIEVLCRLGDKVGVVGSKECLRNGTYRQGVLSDCQSVQTSGVHSVPYFTIRAGSAPPLRFSGAQNPTWWADALSRLVQAAEVPVGSRVRIRDRVEGEVRSFQSSDGVFLVKPMHSEAGDDSVRATREQLEVLCAITPGCQVELHGLKTEELNGQRGEVIAYHPEKARFEVRLNSSSGVDTATKALRGENLTVVRALLPGDAVELTGLSTTELNGKRAEVLSYLSDKGRFEVRLQGGCQVKAIRPDNLQVPAVDAAVSPAAATGALR
eukprot:gnl/TRDRNA2_/TRDRNA2_141862_c0_seq6.p1 gnl/TRDRNA2_/TRDRNA2_141862_c0~~gnl/TRDRNA2_/TRDRNA2_141862_c0_seq6.p1  ORF type:complete len:350 (-),score=69.12 gnl/TRDRNA2_/TRDRNA2_141862_c0_seq6:40-1089(-)